MLRCTIELLPHGSEELARPLGIIEIANIGGTAEIGQYKVILKKSPPFFGALKTAWRRGELTPGQEYEEVLVGTVSGFHRQKRGVYDLLYLALKSCGIAERN